MSRQFNSSLWRRRRRRLGPYSVQSIGAAEVVSWATEHNSGWVTAPTQDTQMAQSSQQAGTHFADLGRMTG